MSTPFSEGKGQDTVPVLLVLYEFEAKAKLGDPDLGKILEKALALPQTEPKTFETLAGEHIMRSILMMQFVDTI